MTERRLVRWRFFMSNKYYQSLSFDAFSDDIRLALYTKGLEHIVGLLEMKKRFTGAGMKLFFPVEVRNDLVLIPLNGRIRKNLINAIRFERNFKQFGLIPNGQGRKSQNLEEQSASAE